MLYYFRVIVLINIYKRVFSTAQTNLRRVFYGVNAITGLDPLDQRSTVPGGIDQINTGLIQSNGVIGCQNTDVMHIWLGRITITVAIHTQSVHDIDINYLSIQSVYHSEETIPIEIFLMAPPYPAIE